MRSPAKLLSLRLFLYFRTRSNCEAWKSSKRSGTSLSAWVSGGYVVVFFFLIEEVGVFAE